ncbi:MAG: hypothetical protein AVDCRST_MAG71-1151 [uncultured Lysobacter sp.]|uniref:HTH luxR-type domain-containing protein n=1 Tax=uncultured Lysobacter sp. TaxID=271060 RepID=A0A6J4KZT2_9GAMM|nr:MAG: hypothetical protein AVDCRST_MAG71-1151 [uncultured Lysobacter sp.]
MTEDGVQQQPERRVRREDRADALRWIAFARSLAATLDVIPQALALVVPGPQLRIWHANAAALGRLASSNILPMREGVLLPAGAANATELFRAVELALATGPRHRHRATLISPDARVAPVLVQALDFGASPDLPVSHLLLLEMQEKISADDGLARLSERFQMTRKEAECALGLYAIGSIDKFARCTGKSIHTVRTQLKAAMHKTDTNTQAALVALVADLINE